MHNDLKTAYVYLSRGAASFGEREYDRAIADCDEAIRLEPENAAAHMRRGIARVAKTDDDRAIVDLDEAIRRDP